MSKQDDAKLAKLVKKLAGRPAPKPASPTQFDPTLKTTERDRAVQHDDRIFKEMKKREH